MYRLHRSIQIAPQTAQDCRLRLSAGCARTLRRALRRMEGEAHSNDAALRRMRADAEWVEACLLQARADRRLRLPAPQGKPRIKRLAEQLVADGRDPLSRARIVEGVVRFDAEHGLSMREFQWIPAALNMALCEAFMRLSREIVRCADARACARRWLRGGAGRVPQAEAAFFEYAMQRCAEMESPERCARLRRMAERRGHSLEWFSAEAQRIAAEHCVRVENLMRLKRLLDATDWQKCLNAVSPVEQEMCADAVYARMDAASKAEVREAAAELARWMRVSEAALVRHALRLANAAETAAQRTICWYFADDDGRAALACALGAKRKPKRRIPDPDGKSCAAALTALCAAFFALFAACFESAWMLVYALPLAWYAATSVVERYYAAFMRPRRLLKLKFKAIPAQARTLVVLPTLLSNADRATEAIERMEALGCLECDAQIDFLLLGDFGDCDAETLPEDAEILAAVRAGVRALNARAERQKYFYLHRARSYRAVDGRWMGENRKRGALMALNRLLLGEMGAAEAFCAEKACAQALVNRYRYVLTLDADTEYLPGTVQKLVGAMEHPLNRPRMENGRRKGYAVLQPAMQTTADAISNAYVERVLGRGGMDGYPVSISDFYQDCTGQGCYAGKGVYDVRAFAEATEGRLADERILSHDLIEGILSGAGFVNDVCFYDGFPSSPAGELSRQHRWTRGDWQLLPLLFSNLGLRAADRIKLLSNLLRSLYAPALLALLIHACWRNAPAAFCAGLILAFLPALLHPFRNGRQACRAAFLQFALLPARAACALDAIARTLWRLFVSGKRLMEWVPAADTRDDGQRLRVAGRAAALLFLPGLLRAFWLPAAGALMLIFFVGMDWAQDLARTPADARRELDDGQKALLAEIARCTWRFFAECVPLGGCGLPPDNVQMDPPMGAAERTSPTNIGLYLLSCACAAELGFIAQEECECRMAECVCTLERLEKWQGQLYNWYDTLTLEPMRPRYVSAVDSGNLAAALLLSAQMTDDDALAGRMRRLAAEMNLAALYDAECDLFCIGMDVENDQRSRSHYDLFASEARILSFAALMLGQVPLRHWRRLSRAAVRVGKGEAFLSWSGTMFEYLMPELFMRSPALTRGAQSNAAVIAHQKAFAKRHARPWGVSESGYYAFDQRLNYQYRAFGLRALSLGGNTAQDVVAPYAAALALCCDPTGAADNLADMCRRGWSDAFGLFEAADFTRSAAPRIIMSHMAHHQGMILCAICNALRGDPLPRRFMQIPQARALRLLLQEKEGVRAVRRRARTRFARTQTAPETRYRRSIRDDCMDVQYLCGGGTTALVTPRGGVFAQSEGLQLNRFTDDLLNPHAGMYVHLCDRKNGAARVMGASRSGAYDAGEACFEETISDVRALLRVMVSPEDGTLYQALELENASAEERCIEVTGCLAAALARPEEMRAHPAFQNLFVESRFDGRQAVVLRRRPRRVEDGVPELIYAISDGLSPDWETDLEKLIGRDGALGLPNGLRTEFTQTAGSVLNPCAALRASVRIQALGKARLHFALALASAEEVEGRIRRIASESAAERASRLAVARAQTLLRHAGWEASQFTLARRAIALLLAPKLRPAISESVESCAFAPAEALWSVGLSGDLPILLAEPAENMDCVRDALRLHALYENLGIPTDLVIHVARENDYFRESRRRLEDLLMSSHLNARRDVPGGAHIIEEAQAVRRAAAICLNGEQTMAEALLGALKAICPNGRSWNALAPMPLPQTQTLAFFNGYGGFDGDDYVIRIENGRIPPAPWSNVLASENAGAVLTERGGGFAWFGNSRGGRLTPFTNDVLREDWGWMFYLLDARKEAFTRLLPGDAPMTDFAVRFAPDRCVYAGGADGLRFETRVFAAEDGVCFEVEIENMGAPRRLELVGAVDWLMGALGTDAAALRTWSRSGACFASGRAAAIGWFACDDPCAETGCDWQTLLGGGTVMQPEGWENRNLRRGGWMLRLNLNLCGGASRCVRFMLGGARDAADACAKMRAFRENGVKMCGPDAKDIAAAMRIETPDEGLNRLLNGFLWAQVRNARIRGRTGLYQPGGAYGFRDQLQDMLPLVYVEPQRVRRHLLDCAARQFADGDVLHWWHIPYTGVRTRISDDMLFLPLLTAHYVAVTGDAAVLQEEVPFLENVEIPENCEDVYAAMRPSAESAALHQHCMRAFRRAAQTGKHGLCRMGSGDWNDGMNRVGARGRGESVWLSEFLAVCARRYAEIAPDSGDRDWLNDLHARVCGALEESAWDGEWYLRAYTDAGDALGGRENAQCRIDLISQAWAVLAELDADRCRSAMEAAWTRLVDADARRIRLLAPPFDGRGIDPGYIAAYPAGIRENGAQYTHAACWFLCALARQGDVERAYAALEMLLPLNHAKNAADAERYRVEPYVMAADIYADALHDGRGGWTWYTGSAAWMLMGVLALLGFEKRGDCVRLNLLEGNWREASVTLRCGKSQYRLISDAQARCVTLDGTEIADDWIAMRDDGKTHTARFPLRKNRSDTKR